MKGRLRHSSGQALTEFAFLLPLLLLLALGGIDVGRAYFFREQVGSGVRDSLRLATQPNYEAVGDTECTAAGNSATSATGSVALSGTPSGTLGKIAGYVMLESSNTGTTAGSFLSGATLTLTWHCSAGKALTNTTATTTDPTSVTSASISGTVTYPYKPLTFSLPFLGTFFPATINLPVTSSERAQY